MPPLGAGTTETLAEKVKVCNTCGDAGFDDCLAFCSQCNDGAEHLYCMVTVFDTFPPDWICEGCKSKQREIGKKRRLVSDGLPPVQAQKKQVQNSFASPQGIKVLHSSWNRKDFSENGTEQIVTAQTDDKAPSNGPAWRALSVEGGTIKEKSCLVRDQPFFPSMVTQNLSSYISNENHFECIAASDVNKPAPSLVVPARNISAKESLCSETIKAVPIDGCKNDTKEIMPKDLPSVLPATCTETIRTVSNYRPASGIARITVEPFCLAEPLADQDISVSSIYMKTSGERVENEKQDFNKTVASSLAEGQQVSVEAEHCNVNKSVDFSPSSLAKPAITEKEKMEVSPGSGKQYKIDHHNVKKTEGPLLSHLAKPAATDKEAMEVGSQINKPVSMSKADSKHINSITERHSGSADAEAPMNLDILIMRPISNSQPSMVKSIFVEPGSMKVASGYTTNKVSSVSTTPPVCEASLVETKDLNAKEGGQKQANISTGKPIFNAQDAQISGTLEPRKGTSCLETGEVISACRNARRLTTPSSERIEEDAIMSSDSAIAKSWQVTVNSKSAKTEYDVLVQRSRSHAYKGAIRDFPIITKTIRFLGEEGVKNSNLKSKGKLFNTSVARSDVEELLHPRHPSGNVSVRKDTAAGQEINGSCNKESSESQGFLAKKVSTQQELSSSCNRLKAKEDEIAASVSVVPPSVFNMEEKAQAQKVIYKGEAAGSQFCVIQKPAERPSMFSEKEETWPQNIQLQGEMAESLSCSVIGSAGFPSEKDKAEPQNVNQKGGVASSLSSLILNSGLDAGLGSTKSPSNGESLGASPCTKKGHSFEVLPMQANSKSTASGAGVYKIPLPHSKRVAQRDFPLIKGQIGKEVSTLCRPKVVIPPEDKELVTGNKSDADAKEVIENDVPAIAREVLPGKLKNGSSSNSMGKNVVIMTPLEDEMRAASTFETKDSAFLHARLEDAESHGNAKQESNATGLASCVPSEHPTDVVSNTLGGEAALVIGTAPPTNSRPALKRKTIKKCLLSPYKDGFLHKGVISLKYAKGPPCLTGEMEGVTVKGNLIEAHHISVGGGCHIFKQKGETLQDGASSSQVRSSGNISLPEGIVNRDASIALPAKVIFTDNQPSAVEAGFDSTERDLSDNFEFTSDRRDLRSEYTFLRSTCMMEDCEQLSGFELRQRDSLRRNKGAVGPSIRERHGNVMYIERESEDDGFHNRLEDAGWKALDDRRMGLKKSTSVRRPWHLTLPDGDWEKQDQYYSRHSRHEPRESSSYKTYRNHRYEAIGHSGESCKGGRQKQRKTQFLSDFDDRVSDLEHVKRDCKGLQVSDGKKRWRYDPKREERSMNGRVCGDSDFEGCGRQFKRPPKSSEYSRYDEDLRYKPYMREEASFERETSRLESSHVNGTHSELRLDPHSKLLSYSRVHERQLVRVQNDECCEAGTYWESGKPFPTQGNASSNQVGSAGMPRSGYARRLLPNQASLTSQDQVYDDRVSQTQAPSQSHGSRRAVPDLQVMWTGCFYVSTKMGWETCYQGFEVRPSKLAHSKVFEVLLDLPVKLKMEERKRGVQSDTWPRAFQESPPTSHSIGIYFFATDLECYNKWYKRLVNRLAARDFALKVQLEFAQLLIFPSQILPEAEQFWDDRYFLWGIFRRNVEDSNHLPRQPSCRDAGSDLESPAGNGEVIDMDVDMVSGEEAVSQQLNPPLPPGFAPPLPYRPLNAEMTRV